MKLKTLAISAVLAIASMSALTALTAGCTKKDWQKPAVEFSGISSNDTIRIDINGGTCALKMKATRDWKIDSIPSWLAISKESGNAMTDYEEISLAAPENPGYNRYAELLFKAGPIKEYLIVKQIGPDGEDDGIVNATVAEVIASASTTQCFRLSGTVSRFNSTYCSFDLTDETGSIYVYSVTAATKQTYAGKLKNNDKVTIEGYYLYYSSKSQHEIINASIVSHTPAN